MWYVYILRSVDFPDQEYTGSTADLKQRLAAHNAGKSVHTAKFAPWNLLWYCAFPDKHKALEFEKYLKSHSGRAFASKRLVQPNLDPGRPVDGKADSDEAQAFRFRKISEVGRAIASQNKERAGAAFRFKTTRLSNQHRFLRRFDSTRQ